MKMRGLALVAVLPVVLLAGCSKQTEMTRATAPALSPEIERAAIQRGKAIAAETFALLSSNLQSAIESGGISNALPFCSIAASPLTAGMADKHGVTLRRVTHKPRNPSGKADAAELEILKSFESTLAASQSTNPPPPVVTNFTSEQVTFFAPIVLNNDLCLRCHGEPGNDIAPVDLTVIQKLYPRDEATGFKLGQLRGAWRIDFPLQTLRAGLPEPEMR